MPMFGGPAQPQPNQMPYAPAMAPSRVDTAQLLSPAAFSPPAAASYMQRAAAPKMLLSPAALGGGGVVGAPQHTAGGFKVQMVAPQAGGGAVLKSLLGIQ